MTLVLAQGFAPGYVITGLCILLGMAAICIPRIRKRYQVERRHKRVRAQPMGGN